MTVILFTIALVAVFWHARQRGAEFTARKIMWVWVLCGATLAVSALASELGFSLFSLLLPLV